MRRLDDWMRPHDGNRYTTRRREPPGLWHAVLCVLVAVATSLMVGLVIYDRSLGEALPMAVAVGVGGGLGFALRAASRQLRTRR